MDKNNCGKPQFSGEKTITTLKEVSTLIMGQSPSSDSYNADSNGLPFYQGNADFGEDNPTPRIWCTDPKKIAEKGDILISVRAPIGAINIADEQCCIGRGIAAIRPNTELVSRDYLRHQLCASRDKLEAMGTGSTFKAIGKKALGDFAITIYPKKGQETIACQFNWVAEHIKLANSQLAQLDNLVKSRFIEMFGDPNSKQCKAFIEDAFFIRDDLRKPLSGIERDAMKTGELYPYYGANGKVDDINQFLTDCDALCFAEDCGSYGPGEPTAYVIRGKAWVNNHAHLLVAKCPHFLEYARTYFTLLDVNRFISGTTRAKMTQAQLKKVNIEVPDQVMLREFDGFVSNVDKLRFMLLGNPSPMFGHRSFCCSTNSGNGGVILEAKDY